MGPGVTILYEDSAGEQTDFALHNLVVRCVADRVGCEPPTMKDRLRGIPKKGNGNVWRACQRDLPHLARSGRVVFAVFDDDRVRTMTKLATGACKTQVVTRIKIGCDPAASLRVVLLVRNTETVLCGLRDLGVLHGRDAMFVQAIDRKDIASRDILFKDAVWRLTADQRVSLLREVPSLGYLVEKPVALLGDAPAPDAG